MKNRGNGRVLVLGASGMLGSAIFKDFLVQRLDVYGTARTSEILKPYFSPKEHFRLLDQVDVYDFQSVCRAVDHVDPAVVINCVGLIRQLPDGKKPLPCIEINARFPHLLHGLCKKRNTRLIHYSTDCVFDGHKGALYTEDDPPSAKDIYGLSKYLGELREAPALTIRTSIIGHELRNKLSLVEWFLAQQGTVKGYTKAIYSGVPVSEHARILREYVLPDETLNGLYHVAGRPISKYELLCVIRDVYKKNVSIVPDDTVREDKTLSGQAFTLATGYEPPHWRALIEAMHDSSFSRETKN